jgi:uncharacterized protein (TIRG00374 family)
MKKIMNQKIINILFPIIGFIIFIYIIFDIGIDKITNTFLTIPIFYYLIALSLFIPRLFFTSYKWLIISKKQKFNFNLLFLANIFLKTMFFGSITPGAIGLHLRIYYLKIKSKESIEKCLTNSLIETGISLIGGLFLALLGSIIFYKYFPEFIPILTLFFIFYLIVFTVLIWKKGGNKIFNFMVKYFIPKRYRETTLQSIDSLYKDIPKIRDLATPFLIELFVRVIAATQVYIIALAFSINIPYIHFIFLSFISVALSHVLPISIGGLGIREGIFIYLLSEFGVIPEIAFVISLSGFIVKLLIPGLIGLMIPLKENYKIKI